MTEEELNMQRENRDYIKESQDFLNETVSITAQLSDQIQFQVNSVSKRSEFKISTRYSRPNDFKSRSIRRRYKNR